MTVVFLTLAVAMFYLPPQLQGQIAAGLHSTLLRPFLFTQEMLNEARHRAQEADRLQAQLDSLAALLATQAPLAADHRNLHELLELRERAPARFVPASVIRPGTAGSESMLLLDVGSAHGVSPGDPVIMRDGRVGLVGVIRRVRRGTSVGIDWSHPDFRASAMTSDSQVYGIVEPWRGDFREFDRMLFRGTPYYEELEEGTLVTTSGLGGVYPRGIPVGIVEGLVQVERGWEKRYEVRPIVRTASVTHVLVVVDDELPARLLELFRESGTLADSLPPEGPAAASPDSVPPSDTTGGEGRG